MSTSRPVDLNEPRESELVYINNRNAYCAKKREQKQHQRRHLEQAKLLSGARSAAQKATQGERDSRPSFLSKWLTFSSPPPSFPVPPIATASTPSITVTKSDLLQRCTNTEHVMIFPCTRHVTRTSSCTKPNEIPKVLPHCCHPITL